MKKTIKEEFIHFVEQAKAKKEKYVAIAIQMDNLPKHEIIINPIENIDGKLEYYKNTYDDNLKHKYAKDNVRIVAFTSGDWLDDIEMYFTRAKVI
jgi:hypothetical protein